MKELIKPIQEDAITVLAYDNENCNGNCGCGGSSDSSALKAALIGAAGTIIGACIGALCT